MSNIVLILVIVEMCIRDSHYTVRPALKSRVRFQRHDLLRNPYDSGFDLISVSYTHLDVYKRQRLQRLLAKICAGPQGLPQCQCILLAPPPPGLWE